MWGILLFQVIVPGRMIIINILPLHIWEETSARGINLMRISVREVLLEVVL